MLVANICLGWKFQELHCYNLARSIKDLSFKRNTTSSVPVVVYVLTQHYRSGAHFAATSSTESCGHLRKLTVKSSK